MKRRVVVLGLVVSAACTEAVGVDEGASVVADPTYFHLEDPHITVCWDDPVPAEFNYRLAAMVRLQSEYHGKSRLRLGGFNPCPYSDWDPPWQSRIIAAFVEQPPSPLLVGGVLPNGPGRLGGRVILRDDQPIGQAVHEFGHVFGMVHEDLRPYALHNSRVPIAAPDTFIGPHDPMSIMAGSFHGEPQHGYLSDGDALALKLLYGAPGSFLVEGNAIYRYHLGHKCHVISPEQLDAFGGTALVDQGLLDSHDTESPIIDDGACRWPDGFYQPAGTADVYMALGGEGQDGLPIGGTLPGVSARLCKLESASQVADFNATDRVMTVSVSASELARARNGGPGVTCAWPDGMYHRSGGRGTYLVEGSGYCLASSQAVDYMGGPGYVWETPSDASILAGRTSTPCQDLATTFTSKNVALAGFPGWAAQSGARPVSGRFGSDTFDDLALVGGAGWTTVRMARSNGDGTFSAYEVPLAGFAADAQATGVKVVSGRFDTDTVDDIVLVGALGWSQIKIAHGTNQGGFYTTAVTVPAWFASEARASGTQAVAGDFDHNGYTDIALAGGPSNLTPVLFGNAGSFTAQALDSNAFPQLARQAGARLVAADFTGDGNDDLALVGLDGTTVPEAHWVMGFGGPFFELTQRFDASLEPWSHGAQAVTASLGGANDTIVVAGPSGWRSLPVFRGDANGYFGLENKFLPDFPLSAAAVGARLVAGDFDGDGKDDLALTGAPGFTGIPVALRN